MGYCDAKTVSNIAGTFCKPFTDNSLVGSSFHTTVGRVFSSCMFCH